jgi:hypothetical protein
LWSWAGEACNFVFEEFLESVGVILWRIGGNDAAATGKAVIGHMKNEGHLSRCYLKGRNGDAANAILTAVGYNFRILLAWMRMLLSLILTALLQSFTIPPTLKSAC